MILRFNNNIIRYVSDAAVKNILSYIYENEADKRLSKECFHSKNHIIGTEYYFCDCGKFFKKETKRESNFFDHQYENIEIFIPVKLEIKEIE